MAIGYVKNPSILRESDRGPWDTGNVSGFAYVKNIKHIRGIAAR
jgi:hypothetical protein